MDSPIIPLEGWIVISPIEKEEIKTSSGIIVQEKVEDEKKNLGLVIAVPQKSPITRDCKVFYKPYAHIDCIVEGKKYLLVELQDLCGVLIEHKNDDVEGAIAFEEQGV